MSKRKTHEEYIAQVLEINPNIEVIGTYVANNIKVLHKCKIDGCKWEAIPSNILRGKGCPLCGRRIKSHEEYLGNIEKINPNIEVVEKYIDSKTKILHRCKIDGYEWYVQPNSILSGYGCPVCSKKIKTTDMFKKELFEVNKDIIVIGSYINSKTKIKCMCKIDGYKWDAYPNGLLKGSGCPVCYGNKRKTQQEYIFDVKNIDSNIEVIGTYVNAKTKILHRCKIDGIEWMADPHHILFGQGCPLCNMSRGEKEVRDYLIENNVIFIPQYTFDECKNKKLLPFDFYLPDYNACVEYDGIQHFKPIERFGGIEKFVEQQHNDLIKTNFCENNNIKLLRIRYDEDVDIKLNEFLTNNNTKLLI